MTTLQLLFLRLYSISVGRFAFFQGILRKVLVSILIKRKGKTDSYAATSRFFDIRDLE
jgi:hypothetical protein